MFTDDDSPHAADETILVRPDRTHQLVYGTSLGIFETLPQTDVWQHF